VVNLLPRSIRRADAPDVAEARLSDAVLPTPAEAPGMWPGHSVTIRGQDIFVRTTTAESPDAEPALFIHGLGGSATNWTDLAWLVKQRLAVESIDLPGFGRSGPAPREDYSLRAHADTVIAYLEQSGRGPVHLVANSMGGAIAIVVAAERPDLLRTLTLISPAVPDIRLRAHPLRSDPRMALLVVPGLGGVAMRRVAGFPAEQRVKATIAMVFADRSRYPRARLEEAIEEAKEREQMHWANQAFLRSMRGLARSQFIRGGRAWSQLRTVRVPTLVIWGDTDRLVAPDLAAYVAAAVPDARLLFLEHVGHTAMMEDPVTTARALLALVEDNAA
jgi:pimeloyl-ACP methyl ester carboxylesterase